MERKLSRLLVLWIACTTIGGTIGVVLAPWDATWFWLVAGSVFGLFLGVGEAIALGGYLHGNLAGSNLARPLLTWIAVTTAAGIIGAFVPYLFFSSLLAVIEGIVTIFMNTVVVFFLGIMGVVLGSDAQDGARGIPLTALEAAKFWVVPVFTSATVGFSQTFVLGRWLRPRGWWVLANFGAGAALLSMRALIDSRAGGETMANQSLVSTLAAAAGMLLFSVITGLCLRRLQRCVGNTNVGAAGVHRGASGVNEVLCPHCRGGNSPAAALCQWCNQPMNSSEMAPVPAWVWVLCAFGMLVLLVSVCASIGLARFNFVQA